MRGSGFFYAVGFELILVALSGASWAQGISFDASRTTGGSIRPGFSTVCDSASIGALRSNGATTESCNGTSWVALGGGGGGGGPLDRISTSNVASGSNLAAVVADQGTVKLTLAGIAGRAYLHSTLGLVAPGVSTTGPISATAAYFSGQAVSRAFNAGSATSFDWGNGNVQYTSANCAAFTFSNMLDGGSYNLVVTGASSGSCTFSHTGLTTRYPTGYGATTASTHTVFAFLRAGSTLYVTAVRGLAP